jgi:hypothetical protein
LFHFVKRLAKGFSLILLKSLNFRCEAVRRDGNADAFGIAIEQHLAAAQ